MGVYSASKFIPWSQILSSSLLLYYVDNNTPVARICYGFCNDSPQPRLVGYNTNSIVCIRTSVLYCIRARDRPILFHQREFVSERERDMYDSKLNSCKHMLIGWLVHMHSCTHENVRIGAVTQHVAGCKPIEIRGLHYLTGGAIDMPFTSWEVCEVVSGCGVWYVLCCGGPQC